MDQIPLTPQAAFNGRGTHLCEQPPPPPPPRQHSESNNSQNSTNDAVVDVDSDYEYVSNPMKVDVGHHRQTSNVCKGWETVSVGTHHDKHSGYGGNERDGSVGVIKGWTLWDICSAYEETDGAKKERSRSQSNTSFKLMNLSNDASCLTDQFVDEKYPSDTFSKKTGSANKKISNSGGKSSANKVKGENVEKSKGNVPGNDAYQKLIQDTMTSTHALHEYQKLIKKTMEPRVPCRQYSIPDWISRQSMEHFERRNPDNGDCQKRTKEAIYSVHEYQKLNRQTMETSGYMSSVKCKHATI